LQVPFSNLKLRMRIKSDTILAGMLLVLGIIIFVGGISYTFDIIVNPPRDNTDTFAIGGAIAICVGSAPLIYGIVTLRDNITYVKPKEEK